MVYKNYASQSGVQRHAERWLQFSRTILIKLVDAGINGFMRFKRIARRFLIDHLTEGLIRLGNVIYAVRCVVVGLVIDDEVDVLVSW